MRAPSGLGWSKNKVKKIPIVRNFAQTTKRQVAIKRRPSTGPLLPTPNDWGQEHHSNPNQLSPRYDPLQRSNQYQHDDQRLKQLLKQYQVLEQYVEQHRKQDLTASFPSDSTAKDLVHQKCTSMHSWIQFITTPTVDTPGTGLLLHFDDKRYIIGNIHEGFSRACIQRGVKLAKASEILITGKTEWKNIGGLMGCVMTLADITTASQVDLPNKNSRGRDTNPSLTIHGGDNIAHTLATGRRFIFRTGMPVQVKEYLETGAKHKSEHDWEPDWADHNLRMWAMVIEPSSVEKPTTLAESKSPGKRSFDDFAREDSLPNESALVTESRELPQSLGKDVCANVLVDMFASSWQKESFEEVSLAEVAMPAQLFVRNKDTKEIEQYTSSPTGEGPVPDTKVLVRKPWPLRASLPPTKPSHSAISYIIRCQQRRGKFLVEKAEALNLPVGRLRRDLSQGLDVQLKDGTIIKPEMVLDKARGGKGVVVVDLPSQDYIHGLVSRPEWKAVEVMTGVEAVIWILGSGVSQNEELQNFMHDHKHLKHIISSPDHCPNYLAFSSSATVSSRLNQMDPLRYPIPIHDNVTLPYRGPPGFKNNGACEILHAERGLKVQLEPSVSIIKEPILPPTDSSENELELSENVRTLVEHARLEILSESMQTEMDNQHLPSPDAEIICLGTGSSVPSKYRNVSATLLRVPGAGSYLLDCGENTLGQLRRMYSQPELGEVLRDLKLIWISHLHADHHLGITSVIKAWHENMYGKMNPAQKPSEESSLQDAQSKAKALRSEARLCIVSGWQMLGWLREYSSVENFGFDRLVRLASVSVNRTDARLGLKWDDQIVNFEDGHSLLAKTLKATTGLADIATCLVKHCRESQAVTLTFPTGFKFSYSGDCRPSQHFAEIGRGSTVLLHEATFEDERRDHAIAKKHSTIGEAIRVGKEMGARRIILTHFSQRYAKTFIKINTDNPKDDESLSQQANAQFIPSTTESTSLFTDLPEVQWDATEPVSEDVFVDELNVTSESTSSSTEPLSVRSVTTNPASADASMANMKVGVAFDYMNVKVKDIMLLEKYAPALLEMFPEDEMPTQVEALDAKLKMAKKKNGAQNSMVNSEKTCNRAGGEPANDIKSNALDNGVSIEGVQSMKQ